MWRGMEFHILGAATRKARAPNERLCRETGSKWLADERVDLAGLWYCKSSVRYGGWPVLWILWTKQASLNRIRHSMGEPVKLFKKFGECKWRNRGLLRYNSSECQRDQSRSNRDGHSVIHRWTDLPKGAYVVVTGLGCYLSVRSHSETRV